MKSFSVAYACDDNYASLTAVSVVSLLMHNPGTKITLFGCRLKPESVELVRSRAETFGCGDFRHVDVGPMIGRLENQQVSKYVSYAVYSRIYIAELLAEDHGRILYLDCDTMVNGPLDELFATEMDDCPIGLAPDCVSKDYYRVIRLPEACRYYNTGVMLIDLDRWRACDCTGLIMAEIENPKGPNPLGDQDIIVRALNGLARPLDPRWNFLSQYFLFSYRGIRRIVGRAENLWSSPEAYASAQAAPAIYHFSGNTLGRPWARDSRHPVRDRYRETARVAGVMALPVVRPLSLPYRVQALFWKVLPRALFEPIANLMLRLHIRLTYRAYLGGVRKTLVAAFLMAGLSAGAETFGWTLDHAQDGGGEYRVDALSAERFVLTGKRTDSACKVARGLVERRVDRTMWSQNVMMFSVRSTSGRLIRVIPEIRWRGGASRSQRVRGERLVWSDANWHNVTLALGTDLGLPDAEIVLESMGLQIDIENWSPGQTGGIEVRNFRTCGAGEVSFAGTGEETFVIVPGEERPTFQARPDALKVFFAFDNDDIEPTLRTGKRFSRKDPPVLDAQQCGGFREELVRDLSGAVTWTTDLASADAIVYSRCRPDPQLADAIAHAVRTRGVPLYAASEIADPEIADLLPCTLVDAPSEGFPVRHALKSADASLADGLSDATFGLYRTCTAKPQARTLVSFADGTPAVIEGMAGKGRVVYTMTAIGQTLVPGRKAYDAFFVRVLSRLTGRPLPEEKANLFAPDGDGWYRGLGRDDFGRFGWEYASGLLVENLGGSLRVVKGDGEYAFRPPEAASRRAFTFAPSGVSSLAEGGEIRVDGRPFARFDGSLAYPGTRWEFREASVRMELFGLATHVAIPLSDGVRVFDARRPFPAPEAWSEPWMVLFRSDAPCEPMLVTFGRKLDRLDPQVEDGALAGYVLGSGCGPVGMVGVTWPWGNAKTDATGWPADGLSADALARVRLWAPRSFLYPVRLDERFRRSADGTRFEIVDRYAYKTTEDEWHTARTAYAPVPPYAHFMKGTLFASPDRPVDRLPTRTGPYADVAGDTVRWSLPVPEPDLGLLPHTRGFDRYDAIANETFREGVKFSSGGGVRLEWSNKAYPGQKKVPEMRNWNMHGALLGVCRMMPNPFGLDGANRAAYARRIALRLLEPLETHTYKMTTRWRVDPMSGARYTIYMNSPRDPLAVYEPASFGSKFLYGDSNETIRVIAAALQMVADRHGQYGAAKANCETLFRHVASYAFKLDDWLNLSAGCIERGSSYAIDMLNTEYGGMCSFARLAEICGETDAREHFLFRAARRMVPTLARLTIVDWQKRNGVIADDGEYVDFSAGCGEAGPRPSPRHPKTVKDLVLYDMSQGICQDLISLYDRYAGEELRRRYFPQVRAATTESGLNWIMCAILAIGDSLPREEMERRLEACAADVERHRKLCRDWPGVQTSSYLEYVYAALSGTPRISDCRDIDLHDAAYDPATGRLTLDFTPGERAALTVSPVGRERIRVDVAGAGRRRTVTLEDVGR